MTMPHTRFQFLGVPLDAYSTNEILEKIKKYIISPSGFMHVVSINPENIVIAEQNKQFNVVCNESSLALCDGIGVLLGAKMCGIPLKERTQGSVLFPKLLDLAGQMSLSVLLIGSQANLADNIAKCYNRSYPKAKFIGVQGYQNISNPTDKEEEALLSIINDTRPRMIFAAFGSPAQELWFYSHKHHFKDILCMGVGGGFNYLSGASKRPNRHIRQLGLEWLYRLVTEPKRMQRQLSRLPHFVGMVIKEILYGKKSKNSS